MRGIIRNKLIAYALVLSLMLPNFIFNSYADSAPMKSAEASITHNLDRNLLGTASGSIYADAGNDVDNTELAEISTTNAIEASTNVESPVNIVPLTTEEAREKGLIPETTTPESIDATTEEALEVTDTSEVTQPTEASITLPEVTSGAIKKKVIVQYINKPINTRMMSMNVETATADTADILKNISFQMLSDEEIEQLKNNDNVAIVEEDGEVNINSTDSVDDRAGAVSESWNQKKIAANLNEAADYTGKYVKVAILDTGINLNSTDLSVVSGVSFVDGVSSYDDDNGHGTMVAEIIAGQHNDTCITGIAPDVQLYSVKVLDSNGKGYYENVMKGLAWAVQNHMDVVCMSFGGSLYKETFEQVVNDAYDNGLIMVAASGNSALDTVNYPAGFKKVVCVGATDQNDNVASFSNRGDALDIVAPGVDIPTIDLNDNVTSFSGTSASVPEVVGVIAKMLEKSPQKKPDKLKAVLYNSTIPVFKGDKKDYGYGIANAYWSLYNIENQYSFSEDGELPRYVSEHQMEDGTVEARYFTIIDDNSVSGQPKTSTVRINTGDSLHFQVGFSSWHSRTAAKGYSESGQLQNSLTYTTESILLDPNGNVSEVKIGSDFWQYNTSKGINEYCVGPGNLMDHTVSGSYFDSAGTYTLRFHCADNGFDTALHGSAYDDVLTVIVSDSPTPVDDYGNSFNTAYNLGSGSHVEKSGQIDPETDVDYFKFSVSGTANVTIQTTGDGDTYGYLYNSGQAEIAKNDDSGEGANFRITQELTAGTYYIKVQAYENDSVLDYTLVLDKTAVQTATKLSTPVITDIPSPVNYGGLTVYFSSVANAAYYYYELWAGTSLVKSGNVNTPSVTFTQSDFSVARSYTFKVQAKSNNINLYTHSDFGQKSFSTKLAAPVNLICNDANKPVRLSWQADTANSGISNITYEVYRNNVRIAASVAATSFKDNSSGLSVGSTYTYYVIANGSGYSSGPSNQVSVIVGYQDRISPSAPRLGFTNFNVKVDRIYFTWQAGTDNIGVSTYEIYRNGAYLTDTGTTCQFTDSGLSKDSNYNYYLKSVDGAGNRSAPSNTITLRTDDYADSFDDAYLIQNFTSGSSITGKFNTITDYDYFEVVVNKPATYNIDVASPNRDNLNCFVKLYGSNKSILKSFFYSSTFSNRNTLTAEPLSADHYYIVVNSSKASAPTVGSSYLSLGTYNISVSIKDKIPPTVPVLTVSEVTSNTVSLSWTASTDASGIAGYYVYRDGLQVAALGAGVTSYVDFPSKEEPDNYSYYIVVKDLAGNSNHSNTVEVALTDSDWFESYYTDDSGQQVRFLISQIGQKGSYVLNDVKAYIEDGDDWRAYNYSYATGNWSAGGVYAYNPVLEEGTVITAASVPGGSNADVTESGSNPRVRIHKTNSEGLKREITTAILNKCGIKTEDLTENQMSMLLYGVSRSVDDNLYFGLINKLFRNDEPNNIYYYSGKTVADAAFLAAFIKGAGDATIAAYSSFVAAGTSAGTGGLCLATGVGAPAGAALELGAVGAAGAGVVASIAAAALTGYVTHSAKVLQKDMNKLQKIKEAMADAMSKAEALAAQYGGKNIVGTTFSEFKPTQEAVNWEKVEQYVQRLNAGEQLPAIDVYQVAGKEGWFIEDGHHRFIASKITGKPVPINYKTTSGPTGMSDWTEVIWKEYTGEGDW